MLGTARNGVWMCLLLTAACQGLDEEQTFGDSNRALAGPLHCDLDLLPGRYPNLLLASDRELTLRVTCSEALHAEQLLSASVMPDAFPARALPLRPRDAQNACDEQGREGVQLVVDRKQLERRGLLLPTTSRLNLSLRLRDGRAIELFDRAFTDPALILQLPAPEHPVGTLARAVTDGARTLPLRFWYPAEPSAAQPAPYFLDERAAVANEDAQHRFDAVHASAVLNAPRKEGTMLPLLVFSTGWGVPLTAYTTIAESLASDGYLVLGVEEPDGSGAVVTPDGTVHPAPSVAPDPELADVWANDMLLAAYAARDASSSAGVFANEIDPQRAAAVGHSLGGAAAVLAALKAPEIFHAAANLDGAFQGASRFTGPEVPVLCMLAANHTHEDPSLPAFFTHLRAKAYEVTVSDSAHLNFSDYGYWYSYIATLDPSVTPADLDVGSIAADKMHDILSRMLSDYFHLTLDGANANTLAEGQTVFPEVNVRVR